MDWSFCNYNNSTYVFAVRIDRLRIRGFRATWRGRYSELRCHKRKSNSLNRAWFSFFIQINTKTSLQTLTASTNARKLHLAQPNFRARTVTWRQILTPVALCRTSRPRLNGPSPLESHWCNTDEHRPLSRQCHIAVGIPCQNSRLPFACAS